MHDEGGPRNSRSLVWGIFLIGLGGAFLLQRFGVIEIPGVGRLWPLVLVVIGFSHWVDRRPGSGLTFILMGAWFMACNEGWFGLDYANSWPLLMVAIGVGIVVRALGGEGPRRRRREGGET